MEQLIADFNRSTILTFANHTHYDLIYDAGGVFTRTPIAKGSIIGEVYGARAYIWEIDHSDYLIIDQDFVLDTSQLPIPRPILSMVREENSTNHMANCTIVTSEDGTRFHLQATADIGTNCELVYYILGHMYL